MDPIYLRGIERILVVIGAIAFGYLGYRLYINGVNKGTNHLKAESSFYKFVFSGVGPGLFFMAFGGIVLITSLLTGLATSKITTEQVSAQKAPAGRVSGLMRPEARPTEEEVTGLNAFQIKLLKEHTLRNATAPNLRNQARVERKSLERSLKIKTKAVVNPKEKPSWSTEEAGKTSH